MKTLRSILVPASVALTMITYGATAFGATAPTTSPSTWPGATPAPTSLVHVASASSAAPAVVAADVVSASGPAPAPASNELAGSGDPAFFAQQGLLQRELLLLTLRSKIAEVKQHMQAGADHSQGFSSASMALTPPPPMAPLPAAPLTTVVSTKVIDVGPASLALASVVSVGGKYVADLVDHGIPISVHMGAELSDGWRVSGITPSTVSVVKGRSTKTLHLGE